MAGHAIAPDDIVRTHEEAAGNERTPLLVLDPLLAFLDEHGLGAGEPEIAPVGEGHSNVTYTVDRGGTSFVLRRPPRPPLPPSAHDVLREARVLSALAGQARVPEVLAVCDDESVIGSPFYVMERVDGHVVTGSIPAALDSEEDRRRMGEELVDTLVEIHAVDWQAAGIEGFGKPEGFHERQVDRWLAHLAQCRFRDIPGIEEAAAWLRGYRPRAYRPGILHGDYQFANVMYRHGAPARLAAIVDWEMATIGDPLPDLGWVLMGWPDPGEDRAHAGYVDYTGMPSRAELCERYAQNSGLPVDEIDYYVVLARFKIAIVLEAGYARYVKGGADNPKIAAFGDVVLDMARKAAELARTTRLGR